MNELFIELSKDELDNSLQMAHEPSGENMASCGNCQGACFCRNHDNNDATIEEIL